MKIPMEKLGGFKNKIKKKTKKREYYAQGSAMVLNIQALIGIIENY